VSPPITVAFLVCDRPALLWQVLAAWSKVRGVEDARLEFYCEPGSPESVALCEAVDFTERTVTVNPERLGHAWNMHSAMQAAFQRTGYVIQANDDYLPATDLLELHAWHRDYYADDDTVLALTSSRDTIPPFFDSLADVWRCGLIGALSGFHQRKWEWLAGRWAEGTANWWQWVNEKWLQSGPCLDVLFPAISRGEDIGDPHPVSFFIADIPPQEYREVTGWRERGYGWQRIIEERPQ